MSFTNKINSYEKYEKEANKKLSQIPDLKGMPGMDAIALLENLGLKVRVNGMGKVKNQSIQAGTSISKNTTIVLELS